MTGEGSYPPVILTVIKQDRRCERWSEGYDPCSP